MSEPEQLESGPALHPVLGFAQYHCGVCASAFQLQQPFNRKNMTQARVGYCPECKVHVDMPVLHAQMSVLPAP